jgi:uncharacterized protein YyaL (SSP411 family)
MKSDDIAGLRQTLRKKYRPNTSVLVLREKDRERVEHLAEFAANYGMKDNLSTFYLCRSHACSAPVTSLSELEKSLS